jgi:hypothetical protein
LLPTDLRYLKIFNCEKMQSLLNCIHNLTSLQILEIHGCPGIVAFPTNLTSLSMALFNEPFSEWELHKLTSLKQLVIDGSSSHLVSFPVMLPSSLTRL